jgi:GNAT superfamily N-acetyltransferase
MRDAQLAALVEANSAEFLVALGRAGGAEERDDARVRWTIGGSPIDYHNAVLRADLAPGDVDAEVALSLERMRAHAVPGTWHVGPSMRPAELRGRLVAHGLRFDGDEPGMALELDALVPPGDQAPDLRFERVRSPQQLAAWEQTLAQGFGEGPREARWVAEMYARIGLDDMAPWRHLLGWRGDMPVATASVFYGAGAAGLYFVMTVPAVRRQGVGTAISYVAMRSARDEGYRVGVLGASEQGQSVYRRIGFRSVCNVGIYSWS